MNEFAGNIPRTLKSCRFLENKSNVPERSQTGENRQVVISPPSTSAETVQIPETDASLLETMTLL